MRMLLDTHVLIWALSEPDRLSRRALDALQDRANDLVVSAASVWELATKHRLGTLPEVEPILGAYPEHLRRLGATELSITTRHALVGGGLAWEHRDPFDRILAAQVLLESVTLVTADPAFARAPGVRVLW